LFNAHIDPKLTIPFSPNAQNVGTSSNQTTLWITNWHKKSCGSISRLNARTTRCLKSSGARQRLQHALFRHHRLPGGTAIKLPSLIRHEAIIAYDFYGQQVLLEKSKK
jgi:hypothetical protein